jgi:DNA topoisomerase-1
VLAIADCDATRVVATLKRRRSGTQLLAYRDSAGQWVEAHADDVNAYIKSGAGGEFTAKDFRTWNATVLAAAALAATGPDARRTARERRVREAIATVAVYLGNTPAVCRGSYVDPRVIDRYREGVTIAATLDSARAGPDLAEMRIRSRVERAVLELLAGRDSAHGDGRSRVRAG